MGVKNLKKKKKQKNSDRTTKNETRTLTVQHKLPLARILPLYGYKAKELGFQIGAEEYYYAMMPRKYKRKGERERYGTFATMCHLSINKLHLNFRKYHEL